jgi:hypothetical protein
MTPQELKDIIIKVANGYPAIMATLTGLRADYFISAVKGYFRVSWHRADIIRNTLSKGGPMTTKATNPSYDLSDLDPTFKAQVESMIANKTLMECEHCHNLVHHTVQLAGYCQTCTLAGNTKPESRPPVKEDKPKKKTSSIHTRPMLTCANPECSKRFRDWKARKYCDKVCSDRASYIRDNPNPKPEAATKVESGTPCTNPECGGVLNLRGGKWGPFYGCSWFMRENRPTGKRTAKHKCRVTVTLKKAESLNWVKPTATATATPEPKPVTPPVVLTDVGQLFRELRKLSADVRDCLGQVAELQGLMKRNCENTGTLRQEFSDLDFKVDEVKESVDYLRKELG